MKRIVALTLAAWLVAACGGPGKEEDPAAPDTPAAAPDAAAPAAQTPPAPEAAPAAATAPGDAAAGKDAYAAYCASCHGADAKGVQGLGRDLATSAFVGSKTDAELVAFVNTGRATDDPLNTTGVPMPPKGGNPALTDQETANIIAYLRTLHP